MKQQDNYHFKVVLVGDSGVGKSNIISRFVTNQFFSQIKTTIGVEFATKSFQVQEKQIKLQVWDTAGQQRYRSMASNYYRGAVGAILVYDITRATTFDNIGKWLKELRNYSSSDMVCVLVGNKSDLKQYRSLKYEHGEQYASKNQMAFFQTSAQDGTNVEEAFTCMVEEILKRNQNKPTKSIIMSNLKPETMQIQQKSEKKKKCCS